MKQVFIWFSIVALTLTACVKTEPVSSIPDITYKSFEIFFVYDSTLDQTILAGELIFDFIDGDADIGIYPEDMDTVTWNRDNYNVFLVPFEKVDSLYFQVDPDSSKPPPWYTIQHDSKLDRVGQNKIIKGTINLLIYDIPVFDSMKYDFYISDRAGNNSNTESTDVFCSDVKFPDF
jgi:hypothetical protein